ncbi:MAG TPA: HAD-IIIA family hydrolase [Bacteroidales bacterium]|mgnify:CR=1 FL=1|nr:HAD-IIIA family hydrolase [Bacteroidales bacterium]
MSLKDLPINKSWTLFLDRDGVINHRLPGDYVKTPEQFEMLPGVARAIKILGERFGHIIVVSNQQGVGKGLMTAEDLEKVDQKMHSLIAEAGGRLDAVFYAPMLAKERHIMRKPRIGMALAARKKFPEIQFKMSMIAGDSLSDMQFGKCLGMKTVLISESNLIAKKIPKLVDYYYKSLEDFSLDIS